LVTFAKELQVPSSQQGESGQQAPFGQQVPALQHVALLFGRLELVMAKANPPTTKVTLRAMKSLFTIF
jgi:hypothetical protein